MDSLKLVPKSNRKPADELADIREQMKTLAEREGILRAMMIAGQCSLTGDEFRVILAKVRTERIDARKIKKELGRQFLRPFLKADDIVHVKLFIRDASELERKPCA